jgi:NAD(P)-dependent dehydrogenase (short-subunit alcohol dehydrogenase family)
VQQLSSFDRPVRALVVGAGGALGGAFVDLLAQCDCVETVLAFSRRKDGPGGGKIIERRFDMLDQDSIRAALQGVERIDLAIIATGKLHEPGGMQPEKNWRSLDRATLMESFAINSVGPALVAKHVLPLLPREGKAVFAAISARVGSISDNRLGGWYGYRASKAALNQLIRTLSIELARGRRDAICVALHPGTVDSGLSRPFQSGVAADKLFMPRLAAAKLLDVIDRLEASRSGELIAWNGSTIAP